MTISPALKVSPREDLWMLEGAFGPTLMNTYAVPYMSAAVKNKYTADGTLPGPVYQSHYWVLEGGVLPNKPGTVDRPLPSSGDMGDLYAYDVLLDAYLTGSDVGNPLLTPPQVLAVSSKWAKSQALNTMARYLHQTLHLSDKESPWVIAAVLLAGTALLVQVVDSPKMAEFKNWLEDLLTNNPAQELNDIPVQVDPFPDSWGAQWDGTWDDNIACVTGREKCK
jgi:hypothetical protein